MYLPDEDHVMRHVSNKRLLRDENGNAIGGFLPQAFELRDEEDGLSVNWLEYFNGSHQQNIEASIQTFRTTRRIGKTSAFGISAVKKIQDVCAEHGANKVRVVSRPSKKNKSHSTIIRIPRDNLDLSQSLAVNAFTVCIFDSDIPR